MTNEHFRVQGRALRVVVDEDGGVYVLVKVGEVVLVSKPDGSAYTIDSRGRCSCKGYRWRKQCKHVGWDRTGL